MPVKNRCSGTASWSAVRCVCVCVCVCVWGDRMTGERKGEDEMERKREDEMKHEMDNSQRRRCGHEADVDGDREERDHAGGSPPEMLGASVLGTKS